jgi:hypothetical protein
MIVCRKMNTEGWFSANFELVFLLLMSMQMAPIYRDGKRVILYSTGKKSTRGIQAVGSKCAPRIAKFGSPRLQTVRGGHFRPINGAVSKFVDPTGPFSGIEGIHVDILVHALSNLGAKRGIKCACKAATRPALRGI